MVGDRQAGRHGFARLFDTFLFLSVFFFRASWRWVGGGWYGRDGDGFLFSSVLKGFAPRRVKLFKPQCLVDPGSSGNTLTISPGVKYEFLISSESGIPGVCNELL